MAFSSAFAVAGKRRPDDLPFEWMGFAAGIVLGCIFVVAGPYGLAVLLGELLK